MTDLKNTIETAFENRGDLSPASASAEVRDAVAETIAQLDAGTLRVAAPGDDGQWTVNEWAKKAVLLSFKLSTPMTSIAGQLRRNYFDKVAARSSRASATAPGSRRSARAWCRRPRSPVAAAYIAPGTVLMPSYVNIGAYVDSGTMVDTWATVGSCAQIGKNVHLSGGVGIGGVLEPLQAGPDHHRGQLLHRRPFRGGRGRHRRAPAACHFDGRVYIGQSTKHLRPRVRRDHQPRPHSTGLGRGVRLDLPADDGTSNSLALYCAVIVKKCRRENPGQGWHQRAAPGHIAQAPDSRPQDPDARTQTQERGQRAPFTRTSGCALTERAATTCSPCP